MKLTKNSKYFIYITILVLFGALNTRANILFFIGYFLIGIFVISFIFSARNVKGLEIKRKSDKVTFQNQIIEVEFEVKSEKDSYFLFFEDKFFPGAPENQVKSFFSYNLNKDNPALFSYKEKAVNRGKFLLGPTEVTSLYPFLIFSKRILLENYINILVYPEITTLKHFPSYEQILTKSSNKIISTTGDSDEFFGIREYQDGDSLRIIDWKVSARLNQLVVKEFEKQLGYASYLVMDTSNEDISGSGSESNFEKSINIAASIIKNRLDNNDNMGLIWGKENLLPGFGQEQLYTILNILALVKPDKYSKFKDSLGEALNIIEPESVLLLVCRKWKKEYTYFLNMFVAKKFKVLFIYLVPESFEGSVSPGNLNQNVKQDFFEISMTGVKLYPFFKGDIIADIFEENHH